MAYVPLEDGNSKAETRSTLDLHPIPLFAGDFQHFYELRLQKPKFYISIHNTALICCSLPLVALALCVSNSLFYDFAENFLPSISAAIGNSSSTRLIWRILIFAHALPRYIACLSYGYYFYYSTGTGSTSSWYRATTVISTLINFFELNSLLLLSVFTSNRHHSVHCFGFASFQVCALIYMILHLALYKHSGRHLSGRLEMLSYRLKKKCLIATVILLSLCTYLYYRYNKYCEPFVFSAFSFCEYLLVLANVTFHSTIRFDLRGEYIICA